MNISQDKFRPISHTVSKNRRIASLTFTPNDYEFPPFQFPWQSKILVNCQKHAKPNWYNISSIKLNLAQNISRAIGWGRGATGLTFDLPLRIVPK